MKLRFLLAVVPLASSLAGCLDWGAFGSGHGPGGGGREGEGEEGEGEGDVGEGEGEGDHPTGPTWIPMSASITDQAELAASAAQQLSSSNGRLFAVGHQHLFELIDDAVEPIAQLAVPCTDVTMRGPVAVDGTDLIVGTTAGAVRFHDDGSCDPEYATAGSATLAVAAFDGGALIFDGQKLSLIDTDGVLVDDHAFDFSSARASFFKDGGSTSSIILVRGGPSSPGQAVRIQKPDSELVVEIVADNADMMAGVTPVNVRMDSSLGAPFLVVSTDDFTTQLASVRVASSDTIYAAAGDASGEVAVVGPSALVAHVDVDAATPDLVSVTGERFGALERIVPGPAGDVWAVGSDVILYWSPASALAMKEPDVIHNDVDVNSSGPLVATSNALFFTDNNLQMLRADVKASGDDVEIVQLVDSVSFAPMTANDYQSRFAFLEPSGNDPARLVEATTFNVVVNELSDDLSAVTSQLPSSGLPFSAMSVAVLSDATKIAATDQFNELYVCAVALASGQAPVLTCGSPRGLGISTSSGQNAITVIDPSPGIDDETYIVSGQGVVAVVDPGETGRTFNATVDARVHSLLIHDCILGFSSGSGWSAIDQDQPLSPAQRRGFAVADVAAVGDRVLLVGNGGSAGELASIPLPADSACNDAEGAPVLDGAAMLNGAVRSQTALDGAAFIDGELYVLDDDGALWHVPTP